LYFGIFYQKYLINSWFKPHCASASTVFQHKKDRNQQLISLISDVFTKHTYPFLRY